ncbi:MAG TPA: Ig-like domain-containing protein [Polyangia bacterium]|jgi:hypothetical protein|nr:Ig-like domain-containing protein [Polyangia bacterium]
MNKKLVPWGSRLGPLLILAAAGCGPLGQATPPGGPPVVTHVVFIDLNRGLNPDLLNNTPPRECSNDNPCIAPVQCGAVRFYGASSGNFVDFAFDAAPQSAQCLDAENVNVVAPSVLDDVNEANGYAANLRVVFNKQMDVDQLETEDPEGSGLYVIYDVNSSNPAVVNGPRVVQVLAPNGAPVPGRLTYDRTGPANGTSDPGFLPYGPAFVFTPLAPLAPATQYRIAIDPSLAKARDNGQSPANTQTSFNFTTEPLFLMSYIHCPAISGGNGDCLNPASTIHFPDPEAPALDGISTGPQDVASDQALWYRFNAAIDPADFGRITVTPAAGGGNIRIGISPTPIRDFNQTPPACVIAGATYSIYPLDITGQPTTWTPGTYTVTIPGGTNGVHAIGNPAANLAADYSVTFNITADTAGSDLEANPFYINAQQGCP